MTAGVPDMVTDALALLFIAYIALWPLRTRFPRP